MNHTKLVTLLIILSFSLNTGYAQASEKKREHKNIVKLSSCAFYIKNKHERIWPFAQVGLGYERTIMQKWRLGIAYSQWESFSGIRPHFYENSGFVTKVDELILRSAYKMIDMYINYNVLLAPKHNLYTGLAFSYNWGQNVYVEWISGATPPYYDTQWSSYVKDVNYKGGVFMLGYDYWCYDNRVNLGVDYRLRAYKGRLENQHDIGFHIGYKF